MGERGYIGMGWGITVKLWCMQWKLGYSFGTVKLGYNLGRVKSGVDEMII